MKIKLSAVLCFALAQFACAQTVSVTGKSVTKTWTFTVRPATALSGFACDKTTMEVGETSVCTVTLNQNASAGGFTASITLPAQITGPSTITIPAGSSTGTFTVTAVATPPVAGMRLPVSTSAYTIRALNTYHVVDLLLPCCAREDHCGVPLSNVAPEPCAANQ